MDLQWRQARHLMKGLIVLMVCVGLIAPSCATAQRVRMQRQTPAIQAAPTVVAEFARQLPPGTRVRATVEGNRKIRGTLLKATDTVIVIQPRARVAEPPVEVPMNQLLALEQEREEGGHMGKAIAVGAAVGAGAAVGVLFILIALLGD
jgi:hypothetical protein